MMQKHVIRLVFAEHQIPVFVALCAIGVMYNSAIRQRLTERPFSQEYVLGNVVIWASPSWMSGDGNVNVAVVQFSTDECSTHSTYISDPRGYVKQRQPASCVTSIGDRHWLL